MSDPYWRAILQQEGISEEEAEPLVSVEKLVENFSSARLVNAMNNDTEQKIDKVIIEPNVRMKTLARLEKQLVSAVFVADAGSPKIAELAEKLEASAYKKSRDLDDYYQNVVLLVDLFLYGDKAPYIEVINKGSKSLPSVSHSGAIKTLFEATRERVDVIDTLRSYQIPFYDLVLGVGARLQELELSQNWTGEEKALPSVHKQMTAVYNLLQTVLAQPLESEIGGVNTVMLLSLEKQIDYWLSLDRKFPIPVSRDSIERKITNIEVMREGRVQFNHAEAPPSVKTRCEPDTQSSIPPIHSLFYNPLNPKPTPLTGFVEHSTQPGLQLPPFNPQKSLPLKSSQPLDSFSLRVPSSRANSSFLCSSPPRLSSPQHSREEDEMAVITNLTALNKEMRPGRESCPGSAESSPRTTPSGKGSRPPRTGRKGRDLMDSWGDWGDSTLSRSDHEHAFILSKLAEVMGGQCRAATMGKEPRQARRSKRTLADRAETDQVKVDRIDTRKSKRERTRYELVI